ncbi:MAG: nitrogenase cofactor biosynthesis protein NifB [Methanosarcinales archaeon]|jgi:nitrogen fixation protein NifB|nr:nitrogenase cofactor biosynthesis protein NifB [Methanosarcinales archaeon]
MSDGMRRKISKHPCYSPEAQHKFGRLHLAAAPSCNIQCNYCDRKFDCVNESRPGVTSEILSPEKASEKTARILEQNPFISVVGIAGPGDPLDNDETFETYRRIREQFPNITLCVSTNGLLLADRFGELAELNVETLTVTLNAIDPEIQKDIISMIYYNGRKYEGKEAAEILIQNQLRGIQMAVSAGMAVKINTVLIPGINDKHIIDIAKKMNGMGVYIMNVMPLINQAAFKDIVPPTEQERKAVQDACAPYVKQMRHCRQCRSDAYGLIGKDLSAEKQSGTRELKNGRDFKE